MRLETSQFHYTYQSLIDPNYSRTVVNFQTSTTTTVSNKTIRNFGRSTSKQGSLLRRNNEPVETSFNQFKRLINQQLEKGRLRNTAAIRFLSKISQTVSKVHHERMPSELMYDYIWPNTEANNIKVKITSAESETPSETMSSRITEVVSFSTSSSQTGKI